MNKIIVRTLPILLLLTMHTFCITDWVADVKVRSSAFIPQSKLFKHIYGNVAATVQIEGAGNLFRWVDGWANFTWLSKHGHSIGLHSGTKINIANFSFGLKAPWEFHDSFIAYIGIGPAFAKVWLHNHSVCTKKHVSKTSFGLVAKSGLYCFITDNLFFDIFLDYTYLPTHFRKQIIAGVTRKHHPNVGGVMPGVGFGAAF